MRPTAWPGLIADLIGFLFGGPRFREVATIHPTVVWVRRVALIRLLVFRRQRGASLFYRTRVARLINRISRVCPESVVYRLVILPFCMMQLVAMSRRHVARFGPALRAQSGLSMADQLADVLSVCLRHPGTLPSEYYVFRLNLESRRRLAPEITNAYQVEEVASLVRPSRNMAYAAGWVSGELEVLNDKEKFREFCTRAGVPVASSVAVFRGGEVQWSGDPALPVQDLFVKPLGGGEGRGAARVFHSPDDGTFRIDTPALPLGNLTYPTGPLAPAALLAWLQQAGRRVPLLLEPRLTAHARLLDLVGSATLPTLRVVTASDRAGACALVYGYLRFAASDISVDNGAAGGIGAMVDPDTAQLGVAGRLFGPDVRVHPVTGRTLAGFAVPDAGLAFEYCLQAHRVLAAHQPCPVPVVGWDVALLDGGPVLTEGNPVCAISTPQKLLDQGSWAITPFRDSVLSHLVPLSGRRIALDPGADRR
jgi:Sugar-transfer associated ATP-grasp